MALTTTLVRHENTILGKMSIIDVNFDASYPAGGEVLDLSAAALGGFTSTYCVAVVEGPYDTAGDEVAITVCTRISYDCQSDTRPVATGTLVAWNFTAGDATGVLQEVTATDDLSTVFCRILVIGT
jgi:hypothetical protein